MATAIRRSAAVSCWEREQGARQPGNRTLLAHCLGSVVLQDVPANTTVAGVPAKIVGKAGCAEPARSMNQLLGEDAGQTN